MRHGWLEECLCEVIAKGTPVPQTTVMPYLRSHGFWRRGVARPQRGVLRLAGSWFLATAALFGCSSNAADPPPAGPCGVTVMTQSCALSGCHISAPGSPAQANLDLTASALGDGHQLVNAPAQGTFCGKVSPPLPVIIDPKNPENSLLYNKLQPTPVCGPQMPYTKAPLSPSDQQCILDWIKTVPGVQ
mgnify:CR=1 FL=1